MLRSDSTRRRAEQGKYRIAASVDLAAEKRYNASMRHCERCGEPFQPKRSNQHFCTPNCRVAAHMEQRHECPLCGALHYVKQTNRVIKTRKKVS